MDDTAIVGENVEIIHASAGGTAVSWSAAIAGAVTAVAIGFILLALGSGIGLALASPYAASPSVTTMTVGGAVWLVLTHSLAFAAGGFVAGRLRLHASGSASEETRFRDGANGLIAWGIGVLLIAFLVAGASTASLLAGARAGTTAITEVARETSSDQLGYFVDTLLRTPQGRQTATTEQDRAQVLRILGAAVRNGRLADEDRSYLAGLVAARSGITQDQAQARVDDIINRARESLKNAADTARKAAEFLAFWTFLSLLFGAVAATLAGMLGGELRDESSLERSGAMVRR